MDEILVATIISEGSKLISEFIRSTRSAKPVEVQYPVVPDELPGFSESGAPAPAVKIAVSAPAVSAVDYAPVQSLTGEKVATSCVGCAIGHLATVAGLLKEAVRFTTEGMDSPNIVDRLNTCLDELNAMERVDLQPAKIVSLPDWEKDLAHEALQCSRETRHFIESGITSADQLEKISANLINVRQHIGNAWLQQKLRSISKEDKEEIHRRVIAKLDKIGKEEANDDGLQQ